MASALQVIVSLSCLWVVIGLSSAAVSPLYQEQLKTADKANQEKSAEESYAPATQPREFGYSVNDGIKGANQVRHETWNNGTMTGMYAYPLGGLDWMVVNYVADDKGFRVVSEKKVTESELMGGHSAVNGSADVDIDRDGSKTSYTVKANEIGQKQKQQQQQQQKQQQQDKVRRNTIEAEHEQEKALSDKDFSEKLLEVLKASNYSLDANKTENATSS
jgi:hypothetical protein